MVTVGWAGASSASTCTPCPAGNYSSVSGERIVLAVGCMRAAAPRQAFRGEVWRVTSAVMQGHPRVEAAGLGSTRQQQVRGRVCGWVSLDLEDGRGVGRNV